MLCSGECVTPGGGAVVLEPCPSLRAWKGHGFALFLAVHVRGRETPCAARWVLSRQASRIAPSGTWGCDEDADWFCGAEADSLLLPEGDQAWSAPGAWRAGARRATIRITIGPLVANVRRTADAHAQRSLPSVLERYAAVREARVPGGAPVAPAELHGTLALLRSVTKDTVALVPAASALHAARKDAKEAALQLHQLQAELGAVSSEGAAGALAAAASRTT